MLELLRTLCSLPGPSGCEDAVRDYIREAAAPYADAVETDGMGNLLVFRRGDIHPERPLMVAAHMDEVGIIVKRVGDEGMLKFGFVGGVDRRVAIGRRVLIGDSMKTGVIGIKAVHLTKKEDRKNAPKADELYIDIGASDKEEALSLVSPGDYGVFDSPFRVLQNGTVKSRAIDDRFGCAVMLRLLREKPHVDTWFVFTAQEEVGLRGASAAARRVNPSAALILETTTAADLPDVKPHMRVCGLRGGAVISFMDRMSIYDRELHAELIRLADENGIKHQMKTLIAGGNDAGKVSVSIDGVKCVNISLPVRYLHSPSSVAALEDMEAVYKLASLFIRNFGGRADV